MNQRYFTHVIEAYIDQSISSEKVLQARLWIDRFPVKASLVKDFRAELESLVNKYRVGSPPSTVDPLLERIPERPAKSTLF